MMVIPKAAGSRPACGESLMVRKGLLAGFLPGKEPEAAPGCNLGRHGESLVASYLQGLGYTIIDRNYRKRFGEIDLIGEEKDTLVFIEVKTRTSLRFGSPLEAVDQRKQRRMSRAALDYILKHKLDDRAARFDVVAVLMRPGEKPRIEHIRNAFDLF
jgi:putative endonuclease